MDVRRVLRLPLVASLFMALLGGPAAVSEPLAVPAVAVSSVATAVTAVTEVADSAALGERLEAAQPTVIVVVAVFFLLTVVAGRFPAARSTGPSRAVIGRP